MNQTALIKPTKTAAPDEGETAAVVALLRQQLTIPEIAQLLNRTPERVQSMVASARAFMEASALQVAANWLKACEVSSAKGFHAPSRDFLAAIGAIVPPTPKGGASAQANVVVVNGFKLPGLPEEKDVTPQT